MFTADLVNSSSTDSASSRKDIAFPLSFEQQTCSTAPTAASTTQKELQETPLLDSYSSSERITQHTTTTDTKAGANFTIHRSDAPVPRPNIMPRPVTINRASLRSRMKTSSPVDNVLRSSSSQPSFSAFSSPMLNYHGSSLKVVSPVPSIIASECSESTSFNNSFQGHVYSYTDNDSIDFGQEKGCVGITNDVNFLHKTSPSRKNLASSPTEQYYFTPVHNDTNESDCISVYYPEARALSGRSPYIPQCREVASTMVDFNNTDKMQGNYGYPPYVQHLQLRQYQMPPSHSGSFYGAHQGMCNYENPAMYCQPVSEPSSNVSKDGSAPIADDKYISVATKIQGNESSPLRLRKKSVDSVESSNFSPTKNVSSSDESAACSSPLPQNLKGDPHRQAKVKTELCLHYARGKVCPFGSRCNYAHGEDELKYTKLFELQRAGLVEDVNTYRTHPCASWVATGAWYENNVLFCFVCIFFVNSL